MGQTMYGEREREEREDDREKWKKRTAVDNILNCFVRKWEKEQYKKSEGF
jgi:hypothetical protein